MLGRQFETSTRPGPASEALPHKKWASPRAPSASARASSKDSTCRQRFLDVSITESPDAKSMVARSIETMSRLERRPSMPCPSKCDIPKGRRIAKARAGGPANIAVLRRRENRNLRLQEQACFMHRRRRADLMPAKARLIQDALYTGRLQAPARTSDRRRNNRDCPGKLWPSTAAAVCASVATPRRKRGLEKGASAPPRVQVVE